MIVIATGFIPFSPLSIVLMTVMWEDGGKTVLTLSVLPSVLFSVTNIFHGTFLSNHASQPFQAWYGALARCPTRRLSNSDAPVIYFLSLFFDLTW